MISLHTLIFCIVCVVHLSPGQSVVDVEFKYKIVSVHKGDMFGLSLSTSDVKLVVGAPSDNGQRGSVLVQDIQPNPNKTQESHRIHGQYGVGFGGRVRLNEQFIVVAGRWPWGMGYHPAVYVYEARSPYGLKATFHFDGGAMVNVAISDNNMIVVCLWPPEIVTYIYDGEYSWHADNKFKLDVRAGTIALSGSHLAIGASHASHEQGLVEMYDYIGGRWIKQQTIQQQNVEAFGKSITLYGDRMAVGSCSENGGTFFTYEFSGDKKVWLNNGQFGLSDKHGLGCTDVSIHKDILVATRSDRRKIPAVCGYAYKLSRTGNNTDIQGSAVLHQWNQIARLNTTSDPMTDYGQYNHGVSVRKPFVFIARTNPWSHVKDNIGTVFVHDLSDI